MQDKFNVGDYVIFRKSMHKVADMLNTSFYDVLTSIYKIIGTEGRCYLMKSDNGYGRVWKIRKSRIDRLGEKVFFVYEGMQRIGDELKRLLGRDLVKKSVVRREKRHSHDLFEEAFATSFVEDTDEFERLQKEIEKEALKELAKAKQKSRRSQSNELANAFVKDVEQMIKGAEAMTEAMCRMFDRCRVRERLDVYDIDINKLEGGER